MNILVHVYVTCAQTHLPNKFSSVNVSLMSLASQTKIV